MTRVEVKGTDDAAFHRALATFKAEVKKSGLMSELKRRECYNKPSVKRRLKRLDALKRKKRELSERKSTYE